MNEFSQHSASSDPGPSPVDVAEFTLVEADLDKRWPETKIEPSKARIIALLDMLGSPQLGYPSIQIAGTNGKTSVARFIDSLLRAFNRRTGRTTSPHLQLATERISVDGQPISLARYVEAYREILPFVKLVDQQNLGGPAAPSGLSAGSVPMSKFEVLTAMAYTVFAEAPIDVAVVETGLGGTWDATNVVDGQVAVVTPIGLDHVGVLGHDLASIAGEKAGIINRARERQVPQDVANDTVAVIGDQVPEAMEVLLRRAVEVDAAVARAGAEFRLLDRRVAVGGQVVTIQGLGGVYEDLFMPVHGEHQAHNATLALAAVEAFFGAGKDKQLDVDAVRTAFESFATPGRLERMGNRAVPMGRFAGSAPAVFLDAAHNPHGARALAKALADSFSFRKVVGVVAVLGDKDADGILEALEPVLDEIVVTQNNSPRALHVEDLANKAVARFGFERVAIVPQLEDALERAILLAEDGDDEASSGAGVVVTGSVVTAGEARTLFGKDPA